MFLNGLNISGSGMSAQRLNMDIISQNLANEYTTTAANGQPYRRKEVVFQEAVQQNYTALTGSTTGPGGVMVTAVRDDPAAFKLEYNPQSPNANANGYVELPNVDTTTEMVNLMSASRSYEADVTAFNAMKGIASTALDIGK